jgi:hypothetical protein
MLQAEGLLVSRTTELLIKFMCVSDSVTSTCAIYIPICRSIILQNLLSVCETWSVSHREERHTGGVR